MSIFGSGACCGSNIDEINEALSGYAKTNYVDVQDDLRVLKAGDIMNGDLDMGGQLVRGLPTTYPPVYQGDEAASWEQVVGITIDALNTAVKLDGNDPMTGDLDLGGNNLVNMADPVNPQDAATMAYIDARTNRVFVIARTGGTSNQTIDLDVGGPHIIISTVFPNAFGVSASNWNTTTGVFTAPADGLYAVEGNFRIQGTDNTSSLGNVYTSINGSTSYATDTNIVYRIYGRTNNQAAWHSFQLSGLVTLNQGDTLRLISSYGATTWTFHQSSSLQIGRVGI